MSLYMYMCICIRDKCRWGEEIRNLTCDHHVTIVSECNLELSSRALLLSNSNKSTSTTTSNTQSRVDRFAEGVQTSHLILSGLH